MQWFSLITVHEQKADRVSGNWVQNHFGTIESASAKARRTEEVNGNHFSVAVVNELTSVSPALSYWRDYTRLDKPVK